MLLEWELKIGVVTQVAHRMGWCVVCCTYEVADSLSFVAHVVVVDS